MDEDDDQPRIPDSAFVVAHRLPTFRAVTEAAEILAGRNGWAVASPAAVVDTTGLPRVARVEATVRETDAGYVLQVPVQLGTGFYVLTIDQAGAPAQVLLQVTNLSAYALTASHDTAVWVNDLRTGLPIAGASIALAGGGTLGATDAQGLFQGATPDDLLPDESTSRDEDEGSHHGPAARFLTVAAPDGRRLLLGLGLPMSWMYGDDFSWWSWSMGSQDWWVAFQSDRSAFRQTDTVHVSGTIRSRDDRSVPDGVEVRRWMKRVVLRRRWLKR